MRAHMNSFVRTVNILTFMSWTGECRQQKHTQHAPSTKTDCDYLNGHINKTVTCAKISPQIVNSIDIAGERRRRRRIVNPRDMAGDCRRITRTQET